MSFLNLHESCALFGKLDCVSGAVGLALFLPRFHVVVHVRGGSTLFRRFVTVLNLFDEAVDGAFYHLLRVVWLYFFPVVGRIVFATCGHVVCYLRYSGHKGLALEFLLAVRPSWY